MRPIDNTITEYPGPSRVKEGWVKAGEFVTVFIETDDPEAIKTYQLVLQDLCKDPEPMPPVTAEVTDAEPVTVLVVENHYTQQGSAISEALGRVAEHHGAGYVVWTAGQMHLVESGEVN